MSTRHGAWIRYGAPLEPEQIAFAIEHYQVAILQPWETDAVAALKAARPDMTVLAYKCLSSTRSFESGPVTTSGVCHDEADESGEEWFAHRADGTTRIEWDTYPGHWQMATWNDEYRERWCDNVTDELEGSLWDGVMADNDTFDDYYGLRPPIEGGRTMADLRHALDEFIPQAGARLNSIGKILVPNIAESRRDPGRWARHSAFGGGFEEAWLAYGPDDYLDPQTADAQGREVSAPGLSILRIASDGTDEHRNFMYGLAGFWIYGAGPGGVFTATSQDGYSATPYIPQLDWDLGTAVEDVNVRGNGRSRTFTHGWAAINLNSAPRRKITFTAPAGMQDIDGRPAADRLTLAPHEGMLYVRG